VLGSNQRPDVQLLANRIRVLGDRAHAAPAAARAEAYGQLLATCAACQAIEPVSPQAP